MKAVIICNGTILDYSYHKKYLQGTDLIICADGGAAHARELGVIPHILLGDFDSISAEDLNFYKGREVEIVKFPIEKDMTDTELAVEIAIERGAGSIVILGGLGTRIDHSLSNIFTLKRMLDKGVRGIIANEHNEITLIRDRLKVSKEDDLKLSLVPVSEKVEGVNISGFYYPLVDATLEMGSTWGVSNEFVDDECEITIKRGLLLVIKSRDS